MNRGMRIAIKAGITLFFVAILAWGLLKGIHWVKDWLPSFQPADTAEYFPGMEGDYTYVIYEDAPLEMETAPMMAEGKLYLPVEFVSGFISDRFFWDAQEQVLTYTTQQDVLRMRTDELTYYVNDSPLQLELPILQQDDTAYIPLELVKRLTNYVFTYNGDLDLLIVEDAGRDVRYGAVTAGKSWLRVDEDEKSHYIRKLQQEERLKIIDGSDEWYRVRTDDGYLGYVKADDVGNFYLQYGTEAAPQQDYSENLNFEGKINMVWHQVTNMTANSYLADVLAPLSGVDVISPTWFALSDSEGTVSNMADTDYVDYAHENGYQVWALFSNSFDAQITHDVLSSTAKRSAVIKQILAFSAIYKLDGINIDFEGVAVEDGPNFVQFIRELTPYLKSQGLVVSVDMYVPKPWTAHYNRGAIGEVIDYLIIMGYDEHYAGSEESGSVASIGFVDAGIADTLKEVPKEKVILGLPFYTRIWAESTAEDGSFSLTSKALGMEAAKSRIEENGGTFSWDDSLGQYYGTYEEEGTVYKVWLEDERSLEEKLKKIQQYDLAGASGWKLGLQNNTIWTLMEDYLKP